MLPSLPTTLWIWLFHIGLIFSRAPASPGASWAFQLQNKLASVYYNKEGLHSPLLYVFLFLMIANCGIYAIAWQQVIKKFSLSTAYANKSVYLLWSQVWAVIIFHENLSFQNIIGILIVLIGVWMVQRYE